MNELAWSWFFRLPTFNFPNISEHYLHKDGERGKKDKIWQARWPCGLVPGVWWPEAGWPRTPGSQSEQGSNSQTEASVAAVPVAHISGTPALRLPGHQSQTLSWLGDTNQLAARVMNVWCCSALPRPLPHHATFLLLQLHWYHLSRPVATYQIKC